MPHFMIVSIPYINLLKLSWIKNVYFFRSMEPLSSFSCWSCSTYDLLISEALLGHHNYMSHNVNKGTFGHARPAKIQIRLRIRAVGSESSLGTFRIVKYAKFLNAAKQD